MSDVHVDDAEVRVPVVKHRDRLLLVADRPDDEGAMTESESNHLGEDWFLENRKNASRCPKLTRIGRLHSPMPLPLQFRKSLGVTIGSASSRDSPNDGTS